MGLTSCGPAPPHPPFSSLPSQSTSWLAGLCARVRQSSSSALVPSALTSWLPGRERDGICLPIEGDWECGLIVIGTICSVGDGGRRALRHATKGRILDRSLAIASLATPVQLHPNADAWSANHAASSSVCGEVRSEEDLLAEWNGFRYVKGRLEKQKTKQTVQQLQQ